MPEYTTAAVLAAAAVVMAELLWLRTGLFRQPAYAITMAIAFGFQVLVDGWLTKRGEPIVSYRNADTVGIRFPWGIPLEDFLFGFALMTLVLILWERRREAT